MPTVTTRPIVDELPPDATLHLAFDLGNTEWSLACAPAVAAAPRVRTMPTRGGRCLRTPLIPPS